MRDKCRLIRLRKTHETKQTKEIDMRALIAKVVHGAVDSFAEAMLGPGDDELVLKSKAAVYRAVAEACLDEAKQIDLLTAPEGTYQAKN
jgi:DNA mismatch repair protein MutH